MKSNRVGIPPEIKDVSQREIDSYGIYWDESGNMNISSYVVKTSSGKINILMLSTLLPLLGTTKDDGKKKPALYKLYDFTEGGTDVVDQKVGAYSVKLKSKRWTIAAFSYILDTVRVNACMLIDGTEHQPRSRKDGLFNLAMVCPTSCYSNISNKDHSLV